MSKPLTGGKSIIPGVERLRDVLAAAPDGEHVPCTEAECQTCCTHGDLDHGVCCDCGKDLTEYLSMEAYDRAKAARYDE
jgi:hypothetical protein